jgi:hypothetical protein
MPLPPLGAGAHGVPKAISGCCSALYGQGPEAEICAIRCLVATQWQATYATTRSSNSGDYPYFLTRIYGYILSPMLELAAAFCAVANNPYNTLS